MKIVDEIYEKVLQAVVNACEPPEGWLKCNKQECVEARALLVYELSQRGLSRTQIADKMNITKSSVSYHISEFENKKNYSKIMKIQHLQIVKELEEN